MTGFWAVLLLGSLCIISCEGACSQPRIRKEWREMTSSEQTRYLNAVQQLKSSGAYDALTPLHTTFGIHGNPNFLPWHRGYLLQFEDALRAQGPAYECVTLPFWDWTRDSGATQYSSPVFDSSAFGAGLGTPCVTNGIAQSWSITGGGCLTRRTTPSTLVFSSQTDMENLVSQASTASYNSFASSLEGYPHGVPHVFVGGQMGMITASPEDPLFWLHHNFVDMIWALWQTCHGYDNKHVGSLTSTEAGTQNLDTPMGPWGTPPYTPRQFYNLQNLGFAFEWGSGNGLAEHVRDSGVCGTHLPQTTWFVDAQPCVYDTCGTCTQAGFGWCKHPILGGYCAKSQGSCPSWRWYNPTAGFWRTCRGWIIVAWPAELELKRTFELLRPAGGTIVGNVAQIAERETEAISEERKKEELANEKISLEKLPESNELETKVQQTSTAIPTWKKWKCSLEKQQFEREYLDAEASNQCPKRDEDPLADLDNWFKSAGQEFPKGYFTPTCGFPVYPPKPDCDRTAYPGGTLLGSIVEVSINLQDGNHAVISYTVLPNVLEVTKLLDFPLSIDFHTNSILVAPVGSSSVGITLSFTVKPTCGPTPVAITNYVGFREDETRSTVSKFDAGDDTVKLSYPEGFTEDDGVKIVLLFSDDVY